MKTAHFNKIYRQATPELKEVVLQFRHGNPAKAIELLDRQGRVAAWPTLDAMLFDLASERKEAGHSYGWYVTVALQRIHGISPEQVREIRTRLVPVPHCRASIESI